MKNTALHQYVDSVSLIHRLTLFSILFVLAISWQPASANQNELDSFWETWKKPGVHAIMRHATAPGYGDPDNFALGDCSTQRNLSEMGKEEARRTGEIFLANGPKPTAVYHSEWCRTTETAVRLSLGSPKPLSALNSFFQGRGDRDRQTKRLKEFMNQQPSSAKLFLVTHQVNISAFADTFTNSGEVLLFTYREGKATVIERAKF